MTEDDHNRRTSDIALIQLIQKFDDFIERYERDTKEIHELFEQYEIVLKKNSDLLSEIAPTYKWSKWVLSAVTIGSLGIAVKTFWSHVAFK